jgi:TPR repeat protein
MNRTASMLRTRLQRKPSPPPMIQAADIPVGPLDPPHPNDAYLSDALARVREGDISGYARAALAYAAGYGTPQDYETAREWAEAGADLGDPFCCRFLGAMWSTGLGGGGADPNNATYWLRKAVDQGDVYAMITLAHVLIDFRGHDEIAQLEAMKLFQRAIELGCEAARPWLHALKCPPGWRLLRLAASSPSRSHSAGWRRASVLSNNPRRTLDAMSTPSPELRRAYWR